MRAHKNSIRAIILLLFILSPVLIASQKLSHQSSRARDSYAKLPEMEGMVVYIFVAGEIDDGHGNKYDLFKSGIRYLHTAFYSTIYESWFFKEGSTLGYGFHNGKRRTAGVFIPIHGSWMVRWVFHCVIHDTGTATLSIKESHLPGMEFGSWDFPLEYIFEVQPLIEENSRSATFILSGTPTRLYTQEFPYPPVVGINAIIALYLDTAASKACNVKQWVRYPERCHWQETQLLIP